jgi:4-amino-4-deoxy-L-arabinose transferase-like glycosyltransferase
MISNLASRHATLVRVSLIALFVLLTVAIALRKQPSCDEAWFFSPIYNFWTHGTTGTTIIDAAGMPWSGVEKYTYWQVPVYYVVEAGWMKLFGLALVPMRMLSVVAGIATLLLWMRILRLLGYEREAVLLIAVLIGIDYAIVTRSAEGRMDMLSAAFGAGALACYLTWRAENFGKAVLFSQTCLALSGLSHPMGGLIYLSAFLCLVLLNRDWRRVRLVHLALAAAPYLVGAAAWGAYIAKDPALFFRVFGSNAAGRLDGVYSPLRAVWREIYERYLLPYGLRSSISLARAKIVIPFIYFGVAIAALAIGDLRRKTAVRQTLVLLVVTVTTMMLVDNLKYGMYLVHIFPFYITLLGSVILWAWRFPGWPRWVTGMGVVLFVGLQLSGSVYWIVRNSYGREYLPLIHYLQQHTSPGTRITGPSELAFGLGFDGPLKDDSSIGCVTGRKPDIIVQNLLYRSWMVDFEKNRPDLYRAIEDRLREYRESYRVNDMIVFLPVR